MMNVKQSTVVYSMVFCFSPCLVVIFYFWFVVLSVTVETRNLQGTLNVLVINAVVRDITMILEALNIYGMSKNKTKSRVIDPLEMFPNQCYVLGMGRMQAWGLDGNETNRSTLSGGSEFSLVCQNVIASNLTIALRSHSEIVYNYLKALML